MANGIEFTVSKDNAREIEEAIQRGCDLALKAMGEIVEGYAKEDCPVDTGRLRNSITHESTGTNERSVGSDVEYAPYVEFIDRYNHPVGKAHFLRDAGVTHIDELQKTSEAAIRAALD